MKTVTFHGFANGHPAFAEAMSHAHTDEIARIAKKRGKLASKLVLADYDDGQNDIGSISAGGRTVAYFTVNEPRFFMLPRSRR